MTKKKKKSYKLFIILAVIAILLIAIPIVLRNNKTANDDTVTLFLPTGSDYNSAVDSLNTHNCISNAATFNTLARIRKYKNNVKGGCYKIPPHTSTWTLLTKLYYGNQDPIQLTIGKYRTKKQLCDYIGKRLEMTPDSLLSLLNNDSICQNYGHNTQTIIGMFCRNTYDIYWNTSPINLLNRMEKESNRFWNGKRKNKANKINLSTDEVITLASIVDEETNKNDEKDIIASVYLNRLHKGMPLQADPTLKYALGDFSLRRILNKHTEISSPYNTYRNKGLPPGPICIPSDASIDAVLANKQTNYLYFCAKSDFSGYHAFATNLAQHNANAAAFHAALNKRNIYK